MRAQVMVIRLSTGPMRTPGGTSLAALLLLLGGCGEVAASVDCAPYLRMHGMLRRAQAQCTFTDYNPEIVETARRCYGQVGPSVGASAVFAGADEFDRMASLRGPDLTCSQIERLYPMVVR